MLHCRDNKPSETKGTDSISELAVQWNKPYLQVEQRGEKKAEHLVERPAHRVAVDERAFEDVEGDAVVAEGVFHLEDLRERVEKLEERQEVAKEMVRDPVRSIQWCYEGSQSDH